MYFMQARSQEVWRGGGGGGGGGIRLIYRTAELLEVFIIRGVVLLASRLAKYESGRSVQGTISDLAVNQSR